MTICFLIVFFQDYKERLVHWFLFPLIAVFGGILFYQSSERTLFMVSIAMNTVFILSLLFVIMVYARIKLRTGLLKVIGLGDLLLFMGLSVSFAPLSFITLFVAALVFSLILHLYLSKGRKGVTVPLAGYMSLFFLISHLIVWSGYGNIVYTF
ncbi:hypothetical protein [Snuella lapsa]|uniref:hypothetical protein n=1 Tax=Snuella lapsa TaxID=870481 RepID=UPI0031E78C99